MPIFVISKHCILYNRPMKFITLEEFIEMGKISPNFIFTKEPYTELIEDDTYDDDYDDDVVANLIHYNGGDISNCLNCCINHYSLYNEYLGTYHLRPTPEELARLQQECKR